jgi:hypothetical protein
MLSLQRLYIVGRSEVQTPWTPIIFETITKANNGVPRGTIPLTKNDATCHSLIRPHLPIKNYHINTCHINIRSYDLCHVSLYGLYRLHIQHLFFYLFDDSNSSRYLSLLTSVWTQTSCVGFLMMRAMLSFVLRQFWESWFLS